MLAEPDHQLLRLRPVELDRAVGSRAHGDVTQHVNDKLVDAISEVDG